MSGDAFGQPDLQREIDARAPGDCGVRTIVVECFQPVRGPRLWPDV